MSRPAFAARALVVLLVATLLTAMLRLAWISDDAYITLRTVENVLAGHGPVWNVGERVQAFTHPLWMWLLALARWCSGEHYFATLSLSVVLSAAAALGLAACAGRAAFVVLVLLLGSRAFGDFATSGLETPLTMLLIVWLARLDERAANGRSRLFGVALVTALLGTTRLDLLVLAAPVLFAHLRGVGARRAAIVLGVGMLPLVLWTAFAVVYYGSPFPITAHAKAFSNGVPAADLLQQGLWYCGYSLRHDPVTVATIAAGAGIGGVVAAVRGRMLAFGVLLYCAYVVRVGGDFMAGRFLVPPLVAATALLARWLRRAGLRPQIATTLVAAGLAFVPGMPAWLQPIAVDLAPVASEHGVIDERRFYFARSGLVSPQREVPNPGEGSHSLRQEGRTSPLVAKCDAVGRDPFVAGELFYFVDRWIVDPLLVRLPVLEPGAWRIGHFTRGIPDGYLESLAADDNRIVHPGLRAFYGDLRLSLRAPVWRRDRLAALWRLWTGTHRQELSDYVADAYRTPPRRELPASSLPPTPVAPGTFWFDEPGVVLVPPSGLGITFAEPAPARSLRLSLAPLVQYHLTFFVAGERTGEVDVPAVAPIGPPPRPGELLAYLRVAMGQRDYEVEVPEAARAFDRLEIGATGAALLVPALGGVERRR